LYTSLCIEDLLQQACISQSALNLLPQIAKLRFALTQKGSDPVYGKVAREVQSALGKSIKC